MPYRINLLFHRYLKFSINGLAKLSSVGEFESPMKEQINESCNAEFSTEAHLGPIKKYEIDLFSREKKKLSQIREEFVISNFFRISNNKFYNLI